MYVFISFGRPRPVTKTLPFEAEPETYLAAATIPTDVGATIALMVGFFWIRPWVSVVDSSGLSRP